MSGFIRIFVFSVCAVMVLGSCRRINTMFEEETVARVGDAKLYMSDVATIFTPGLEPQDSMMLLERYVDAWVKKQLKIQEAERLFPDAVPDIERKVADYRGSLLSYKSDLYYIETRLDTVITQANIEDYYAGHKQDFTLDRTIVKGLIVKLPDNHRQRSQIKELMTKEGEKYQDFLDLSRKNGFTVHEVAAWMDFSDFLNLLPTTKLKDYNDLLTKTGVQEMRDGHDLYYITIGRHLGAGDPNPIERVADTIRKILLNQRRQEIIRSYEDSIYRAALGSKLVEINITKEKIHD